MLKAGRCSVAQGINEEGAIIAVGAKDGQTRGVLLLPEDNATVAWYKWKAQIARWYQARYDRWRKSIEWWYRFQARR
jgi:hypothetical protein